jgi:hypothetical protein
MPVATLLVPIPVFRIEPRPRLRAKAEKADRHHVAMFDKVIRRT